MAERTQKATVLARLERYGKVDNFWAFHNYILRLGAIIFDLRRDGFKIDGAWGTGKNKRNFIYTLKR